MMKNIKRIAWVVMLLLLGCSLPDEYQIYHWADYWLTTMDFAGKDSTALRRQLSDQVPPGGLEYAIPFLRHGERKILMVNSGKIYVADSIGENLLFLAENVFLGSDEISIAPNGECIVFSHRNDLYRLETDGSNFSFLTSDTNFSDVQPSYSFDGKKIAFVREKRGEKGWDALCYLDTDNDSIHVLRTTNQENDKVKRYYYPRFDPSGQYVYYLFSSVFKSGLYRLNISNGQTQLILKTYINYPHPVRFAETGRYLFENSNHLYVGESDGNAPVDLGRLLLQDYGIAEYQLSNDGMYIVYVPYWRTSEIWLMRSDGTQNRKLTLGVHPFFIPGEKRILFYAKHWHKGKDGPNNLDFGWDF